MDSSPASGLKCVLSFWQLPRPAQAPCGAHVAAKSSSPALHAYTASEGKVALGVTQGGHVGSATCSE